MKRLLKPRYLLAIAVTALLVGAVACSSDEDPTAVPAAPAPAAPPTPDAAARAAQVQDAELRALATEKRGQRVEVPPRVAPAAALAAVAVGEQVVHFSPETGNASNWKPWREGGGNRLWISYAFMPPFMFDKNNELVQGFATAFSLSEDGTTYTFHLNPNATFNDGSPVTALRAKLAWEYAMQPHEQVGWGGSTRDMKIVQGADGAIAGEREDIPGIVVIDDHTIEFNLIKNFPTWPYRMAIWMQGVFDAEKARLDPENFFLNPVSVSPYTIQGDPDKKTITLTATDNYWEARSTIDRAEGIYLSDNETKLLMFENGDLDLIYAAPRQQRAVHEPSHPMNKYLIDIPYGGITYFARWNTAREPLQDLNVRKALSHAVDQDTIIPAVLGSGANRAKGILQSDIRCWTPDYQVAYEYDPEKAKQFLAQSEYGTGANTPPLKVHSTASRVAWNQVFEAWQSQWKENLGIEFEVHLVESGSEVPPDMNIKRSSSGAYVPDPGFLLNVIVHTREPGILHINDALDQKLDIANDLALDDPGRCQEFRDIDNEFMAGYYILPIHRVDYKFLANPWLIGFETSVNNDFYTLPFMKVGEKDRSKY